MNEFFLSLSVDGVVTEIDFVQHPLFDASGTVYVGRRINSTPYPFIGTVFAIRIHYSASIDVLQY